MNLQSKFGYCMTTQTLNIALGLYAGRNFDAFSNTDGKDIVKTQN